MSNLVPPELAHLETLTMAEIERRVQELRSVNPCDITDDQLTLACALHAIARRKTAGPPKPKAGKTKELSLSELSGDLGL